ncbi:MAG: D-alanyl-D-alanine carboxypeptidase, partial [Alphaproteobacteria bacterium]|nr:D-alanyl-D-alanine carboxypeptidase [Alphaproteobacteria bacterium]
MGLKSAATSLLSALALAVLLGASGAADAAPRKAKAPAGPAPKQAAIVFDATTGQVIHEVNADARTYPASLTKMMTLYLTFDALKAKKLTLGSRLPVSAHAAAQNPSKLYLEPGDSLMVEEAILALAIKSANDAAVVLAEGVGGTESNFARMMTRKARELGMDQTVFVNASGLPNRDQVTTARDMLTLSVALFADHPDRYHYFARQAFEFRGAVHGNHNKLLGREDGVDGI